jgi:hypothetical protein
MSCDISYIKDQKYILVLDENVGVKVASYDKEYHRDIMQHIGANKEQVLG